MMIETLLELLMYTGYALLSSVSSDTVALCPLSPKIPQNNPRRKDELISSYTCSHWRITVVRSSALLSTTIYCFLDKLSFWWDKIEQIENFKKTWVLIITKSLRALKVFMLSLCFLGVTHSLHKMMIENVTERKKWMNLFIMRVSGSQRNCSEKAHLSINNMYLHSHVKGY